METLAPRAAYEKTEPGYWMIVWLLIGFLGTGLSACFDLLDPFGFDSEPRPAVLEALVEGAFKWLLIGAIWIWLTRRSIRKTIGRVYAGDPKLVEPPPPGREYLYRLPCAMITGRGSAGGLGGMAYLRPAGGVGGVLYLGPEGAVFQPHRRAFRRRLPVFLEPVQAVQARLVEYTRPPVHRLLPSATPRALELSAGGATARFLVPRPEDTLAALEARIAALAASSSRGDFAGR